MFFGRKATPGYITTCARGKPSLWSCLDPEVGQTTLPLSVPPRSSHHVSSVVSDLVFLLTRSIAVSVLSGAGGGGLEAEAGGTRPALLRRER